MNESGETVSGSNAVGRFRQLRYKMERQLGGKMPPLFYCWLDERLRKLMNPARRGGRKHRVGLDDVGLYMAWDDGERFYFNHHLLHNRYLWPDGLATVQRFILDKYSDGEVTVESGHIVVEAGANVGEFTTAIAGRAGYVYAYEPDPMTFGCLTRNVDRFDNVTIFHAGLGDYVGEADLYLSRENSDSSFISPANHVGIARVPMITLSEVVRTCGLSRVDFLKVEAEGFEPEILAGAGNALRRFAKVAVDCGPERQGLSTYDECEDLLTKAGFRTWRRDRDWMLFGINEGAGR